MLFVKHLNNYWTLIARATKITINSKSSYADCIRYLLQQCDKYGLHHEVISGFVRDIDRDHFTDMATSAAAPPMSQRAFEALYEWDI